MIFTTLVNFITILKLYTMEYACAETHPSGNNFINGYASSLKPIVITMIAEAGVGSRGRALMRSKLEKNPQKT